MMKKWMLWVLVTVLVVGLGGTTYYFYNKYQKATGKNADREIKQLVDKVGKMILLPDEVPTMATVTDKSKLAGQKFFRNAKNNDKVLIFSLASKAILYRPDENKIIEVASVTMNDQGQASVTTPSVTPAKKQVEMIGVELYNGSKIVGLTTRYEGVLTEKFKNVVVLGKETAKKTDYVETVVIDITGRSPEIAKEVAETLGAKIVPMPAGENSPVADILVILGNNAK